MSKLQPVASLYASHSNQSKQIISASKPQANKQCRVCGKNNVKQSNTPKEAKYSDKKVQYPEIPDKDPHHFNEQQDHSDLIDWINQQVDDLELRNSRLRVEDPGNFWEESDKEIQHNTFVDMAPTCSYGAMETTIFKTGSQCTNARQNKKPAKQIESCFPDFQQLTKPVSLLGGNYGAQQEIFSSSAVSVSPEILKEDDNARYQFNKLILDENGLPTQCVRHRPHTCSQSLQVNQAGNRRCGYNSKRKHLPCQSVRQRQDNQHEAVFRLQPKSSLQKSQMAKYLGTVAKANNTLRQNEGIGGSICKNVQGIRIQCRQVHNENQNLNHIPQKRDKVKHMAASALSITPQSMDSRGFENSVGTRRRFKETASDQLSRHPGMKDRKSREKNLRPEIIRNPTLLYNNPSQTIYRDHSCRKRSSKSQINAPRGPITKILSRVQESENSSSSSYSASSWTTQQTSSNIDRSCSSTSASDVSASKSMVSSRFSSQETSRGNTSNTNSSELSKPGDYARPSSSPMRHGSRMPMDDTSDNYRPCSNKQYSHVSSSRQLGYNKKHSRLNQNHTKRNIGGLRRIKNKLGLIFHHHRRHHHHHHNGDEFEEGHEKSKWKYFQKTFQGTEKEKNHGGAIKTTGKSMVKREHKQRNLHTLVEGLLRHFRHSKESKSSKVEFKGLANAPHGRKKAKKLPWGRKFLGQKKLKQLARRKPRVRLGFGSKKSLLGTRKKK